MTTNRDLVLHLYNNGIIRSNRVIEVMDKVDRKDFSNTRVLYDRPEKLILNQTISAPSIHGRALEVFLRAGRRRQTDAAFYHHQQYPVQGCPTGDPR